MLTERHIPLIGDDIYGNLAFGVGRPRAAKSYDRDGWVLLCDSFTKTLSPGIRLGWIAPAGSGKSRAAEICEHRGRHPPCRRWRWRTFCRMAALIIICDGSGWRTGNFGRCRNHWPSFSRGLG